MGDRGQVFIKDEGVYLYTHWGAHELVGDVRRALAKKWRWDDPEYLARIIFDCMVAEQQGEETGFGISTGEHEDIWLLITVDCKNQKVTVKDDYAGSEKKVTFSEKKVTFEEFIK